MNFITRIFGGLWKFLTGPGGEKAAQSIEYFTRLAEPIVKEIALLTPTRKDDEIIALFDKYGMANVDAYLALPAAGRGAALLAVATNALAGLVPSGTATSLLQTAIHLALANLKFGN